MSDKRKGQDRPQHKTKKTNVRTEGKRIEIGSGQGKQKTREGKTNIGNLFESNVAAT